MKLRKSAGGLLSDLCNHWAHLNIGYALSVPTCRFLKWGDPSFRYVRSHSLQVRLPNCWQTNPTRFVLCCFHGWFLFSPASPSVLKSGWKPHWDSLSFWNKLYLLDVSPHRSIFPFPRLYIHICIFSSLNGVQSLFIRSQLHLHSHLQEEIHPLPTQTRHK